MTLVFWGMFVAGLVACAAFGILPSLKRAGGNWLSPWIIAGALLGLSAIGLAVAFWANARPGPLASDRAMVLLLGGLFMTKVVLSLAHRFASSLDRA